MNKSNYLEQTLFRFRLKTYRNDTFFVYCVYRQEIVDLGAQVPKQASIKNIATSGLVVGMYHYHKCGMYQNN